MKPYKKININEICETTMTDVYLTENRCRSFPCRNGGSCLRDFMTREGNKTCRCRIGYWGDVCDKGT